MKKGCRQNYPEEYKESLLVASDEIEGGNGLPFDCCGLAQKLQTIFKTLKSYCDDYIIKDK